MLSADEKRNTPANVTGVAKGSGGICKSKFFNNLSDSRGLQSSRDSKLLQPVSAFRLFQAMKL
jgi:hypothetical protein